MKVKIDTKEKMHVITIDEEKITANMTEDIENTLSGYLQNPVANIILNFEKVSVLDLEPAKAISEIQQLFNEQNHSMVSCNFQSDVSDFLDNQGLLELMNVTPTESEAWDIVQMEEIERDFLS